MFDLDRIMSGGKYAKKQDNKENKSKRQTGSREKSSFEEIKKIIRQDITKTLKLNLQEDKMKGKVKFFDRTKRFGFIAGEDNKEYFVHESGIKEGSLNEDDEVKFDVEDGDRGPKAVNVEKSS